MNSRLVNAMFLFFLISPVCFAQDPLPIISSSWRLSMQKATKVEIPTSGPAKALTADDTYVARTSREFRTDHPQDPSEVTPDGRRAEMEKIEQQANTPQPKDQRGYSYS